MEIRVAATTDDVAGWVRRSRGDTVMAVRGRLYDIAVLPALVTFSDNMILAVLDLFHRGRRPGGRLL